MTERLYDTDAFCAEFDALVLSCETRDGHFAVRLDRTAFFPEGGGQYGDRGTLNDVRVFDTQDADGEVLHLTDAPLRVGDRVHGKLDFALRFRRMQCHSGEHVVSGIIHKYFGGENVGFHLGDDDVTIDIDRPLSTEELCRIETLANEAVSRDWPIRAWFPEKAEADALTYRAKRNITEGLRLVEVGDVDLCACCAPHVRTTGQIGIIKLLDHAAHKGGVRIHLLCGGMALDDYRARYAASAKISALLSAEQTKIADAVERLKAENGANKAEITALRRAMADLLAEAAAPTAGNLLFFPPFDDMDALRAIVNRALPKCGGICAAFAGEDGNYRLCIGSANVPLKQKAREIGERLHAKCGGTDQMLCGSAAATRAEIEDFLK